MKLGIDLACLGLPLRESLTRAARMGVAGVVVRAVGELSPRQLSQTGRREFRQLLRSHNLDCLALFCPLRYGLGVAEGQMERIDILRQCLTMSADLGARLVVIQAGPIPADEAAPEHRRLVEALADLGSHGDRTGTVLALETGLESGATLADLLGRFDSAGLGACYDPANLLLNGFDPYESARALRGKVALCQAQDARRGSGSRAASAVPLGHGDLDWLQILAGLEEIEFRGWLTVKREGEGANNLAEVAAGLLFLRRLVGKDT